jgi:hypothetical protein
VLIGGFGAAGKGECECEETKGDRGPKSIPHVGSLPWDTGGLNHQFGTWTQ